MKQKILVLILTLALIISVGYSGRTYADTKQDTNLFNVELAIETSESTPNHLAGRHERSLMITLKRQPTNNLTIAILTNPKMCISHQNSLQFSTTNWQQPQAFHLQASNTDSIAESEVVEHHCTPLLRLTSQDTAFGLKSFQLDIHWKCSAAPPTSGSGSGDAISIFELQQGILNTKFITQTEYNTISSGGLNYAINTFTNTPAFIYYTNGTISPNGTNPVVASTSDTNVHGNFVFATQNGSGKPFTTSVQMTNFVNTASKIIPLCVSNCTTNSKASIQGETLKASTSPDYIGQSSIGTNAPLVDLTNISPVTSLTNFTASGESNVFNLIGFGTNTGNGEYYKKIQFNFVVPAFTPIGTYVSMATFTSVIL